MVNNQLAQMTSNHFVYGGDQETLATMMQARTATERRRHREVMTHKSEIPHSKYKATTPPPKHSLRARLLLSLTTEFVDITPEFTASFCVTKRSLSGTMNALYVDGLVDYQQRIAHRHPQCRLHVAGRPFQPTTVYDDTLAVMTDQYQTAAQLSRLLKVPMSTIFTRCRMMEGRSLIDVHRGQSINEPYMYRLALHGAQ